jgi:hypothetical protein
VKDLSRLGRDLADTIIVDNSPHAYVFHPDNAVPVSTFIDNLQDQELLELLPALLQLGAACDVRPVLGPRNVAGYRPPADARLPPSPAASDAGGRSGGSSCSSSDSDSSDGGGCGGKRGRRGALSDGSSSANSSVARLTPTHSVGDMLVAAARAVEPVPV